MSEQQSEPSSGGTGGGHGGDDDGPTLAPGTVVEGRYRVESLLGSGGMGAVYEATHLLLDHRVALKCLHAGFARDPLVVERFKREARAATSIGHDHIVDVTDMGDLPDGAPYLVMELLAGESLGQRLERGPLSIGLAVRIAVQVADALEAAHDKGIVHRDLKPDNIFLVARRDGAVFVKVLDFGISKMRADDTSASLTQTGMAIGTPSYMSPEQAQGLRSVDHRTDIYALGVILYQMLTGALPFRAPTYPMLLLQIVSGTPMPMSRHRLDLPEDLEALVHRTFAREAEDRPQRMRELESALGRWADFDAPPRLASVRPEPAATSRSDAPTAVGRTPRPGSRGVAQGEPEARGAGDGRPGAREGSADVTAPLRTRAPGPGPAEGLGDARPTPPQEPSVVPGQPLPWRVLAAGAALAALGGVAFLVAAPRGAPSGLPETGPSSTPPSPVREAGAPASPEETPREVRLVVRATPADARISLDGVEYPNPVDAWQPRSLAPRLLRVDREGFRGVERRVILDADKQLDIELAELSSAPVVVVPPPAERPSGGGSRPASSAGTSRVAAVAESPRDGARAPEPPAAPPATPSTPPADDGIYRGREGAFRGNF